jgi:CubicO group peptidase (beta-lactamase class C family)
MPASVDRREFLGALGALACTPGAGAPPNSGGAAVTGASGEQASLHDTLAAYVGHGKYPGVVAAVVRDGREQFETLGVKSAGSNDHVERDTIFRIASMTKPVTAAATLLLVDDGKLRLDEPVERLLPELAARRVLRRLESPLDDTVPASRAISVRDLLTFRLGFGLLLAPPGTYPIQHAMDELALGQGMPAPATPPAPDEWLRRLGTLPLMHQPGERWMYNTGADVLGVLVARAAGQPFDAFLRERLFEPLGMHDTDFSVPPGKRSRFVPSYLVDPKTGALTLYDTVDGQWSLRPAFPSGAGGLVSTAPDFLRFAAMLAAGGLAGQKRILREVSVKQMTTDALTPQNKAFGALVPGYFDRHGWGFCLAVVTARDELGRSRGSYGWDGGLGSSWYNDPVTKTTGVLLTQRAWTEPAPPPLFVDFWRAVERKT